MSIPKQASYVVVGAGIHGLSTAYHLAKELRARGAGSGADVVVLDKSKPGAGASGIACGVVRNNYFQPAMSELMQACVEVWESDPGRVPLQLGRLHRARRRRCRSPTSRRRSSGRSGSATARSSITGEAEVDAHMKALFPDWRAQGVTDLPPRAPGRLRVQRRVGARAARQVPRRRGLRARRRRGHRLRVTRRRLGRPRSRRARARSRSASRS